MPDRDAPVLGFDTSAAHCAAAVIRDGHVLAERSEPMARGQAERLFPFLEEVLAEAGIGWRDLAAVGVGTGPGNFTGIRIAVAAARGLSLGLGVPAVGVTVTEAAAFGLPRPCRVAVPLRGAEVVWQDFADDDVAAARSPQGSGDRAMPACAGGAGDDASPQGDVAAATCPVSAPNAVGGNAASDIGQGHIVIGTATDTTARHAPPADPTENRRTARQLAAGDNAATGFDAKPGLPGGAAKGGISLGGVADAGASSMPRIAEAASLPPGPPLFEPRWPLAVGIAQIAAQRMVNAASLPRPAPVYLRPADAAPPRDPPPRLLP